MDWRITANESAASICRALRRTHLGGSSGYSRDGPGPIASGDELDPGLFGKGGSLGLTQRNSGVNEIVFGGQIGDVVFDTIIRLTKLVRPSAPFIETT
jgi:hypothetical protein